MNRKVFVEFMLPEERVFLIDQVLFNEEITMYLVIVYLQLNEKYILILRWDTLITTVSKSSISWFGVLSYCKKNCLTKERWSYKSVWNHETKIVGKEKRQLEGEDADRQRLCPASTAVWSINYPTSNTLFANYTVVSNNQF